MVDRLVQEFQPLKVVLFGSHARNEATDRSDIDLLVVMPDGLTPRQRRDLTVAMLRTLRDLPVAKDVVVTTPEIISRSGDVVGTVLSYALEEGRTVYERT